MVARRSRTRFRRTRSRAGRLIDRRGGPREEATHAGVTRGAPMHIPAPPSPVAQRQSTPDRFHRPGEVAGSSPARGVERS